ncbi:hypothetical protein [Inmirania thermothiophila]|uniref:Uncharacterized protein n=1 Tax=Inmirania thermothiophila TaxID=1750597 RepID=A0A3N1XSN0_9GAMM|nr:hypothetical protein [Inmirania thermothiophila]ROR29654.1 hypothetical protein EDC57_2325 [Inmirania thermothiophila]
MGGAGRSGRGGRAGAALVTAVLLALPLVSAVDLVRFVRAPVWIDHMAVPANRPERQPPRRGAPVTVHRGTAAWYALLGLRSLFLLTYGWVALAALRHRLTGRTLLVFLLAVMAHIVAVVFSGDLARALQ